MKSLLLIALTISAFGCATGQYDPRAGDCKKGGALLFTNTNILNSYDPAYDHCVDKRNYESRLKTDPEFAKAEALKISEEKKVAAAAEKQKQQLEANKKNSLNLNTKMSVFKKYWGEPKTEELYNGAKVLWYDDQEKPFFVIFKDEKLASYFIDRDTIAARQNENLRQLESAEAERRHMENMEQQRKARIAAAFSESFKPVQQQPYMMPINKPTTTNCNKIGNTVNCTSY